MTTEPQDLHFLHVSKTGGTAVREALADHHDGDNFRLVMHRHQVTLKSVAVGDAVVLFLRDPITRFASAFASRQRRGQPRHNHPNTEAEVQAFARFATPNELANALSSSTSASRSDAEEAMRGINHVRIHYADWFHGHDYFLSRQDDLFFIGFQESLAQDFDLLRTKLGLPTEVRLPQDPVAAHRRPADQPHVLDAQAVHNLQSWYADDLAFFELCRSISADINARPWTNSSAGPNLLDG